MSRKILIIEDDKDISYLLEVHLQDMGYDVTFAHDGTAGLEQARSFQYNLIILDLMLPGVAGLEVCKRIRANSNYTPILMLTCKSSELDRVLGLEIGADDYLTRPFSIRELLARVKAIFRRMDVIKFKSPSYDQKMIKIDELLIDIEKRKVKQEGTSLNLTAKEFDLLLHFARHPGRVYTRSQLLNSVWGYGFEGYEHTVNSHINRLRTKVEKDPTRPRYIITVWGVGYKFLDDWEER